MKVVGIFHLHSNYSYDGELSLEEIVKFAKKYKYSFVILNEHLKDFSKEKYFKLISHCQRLSQKDFCLIPGVEFPVLENKVHILALDIDDIILEDDPKKILDFIKRENGLAILAHPYREKGIKLVENFIENFFGIEIWNVREDGKGIPKYRNIKYLERLRRKGYNLLAFGGLDFHGLWDFGFVNMVVEVDKITKEDIIHSIRLGNFYLKKGIFLIDSQGKIKGKNFYIFSRFIYATFRNLAKLIEKILKILKIKPPEFLLRIARKLF